MRMKNGERRRQREGREEGRKEQKEGGSHTLPQRLLALAARRAKWALQPLPFMDPSLLFSTKRHRWAVGLGALGQLLPQPLP